MYASLIRSFVIAVWPAAAPAGTAQSVAWPLQLAVLSRHKCPTKERNSTALTRREQEPGLDNRSRWSSYPQQSRLSRAGAVAPVLFLELTKEKLVARHVPKLLANLFAAPGT